MSHSDADRRRRQVAKTAFQRLSTGDPLSRKDLFADPVTGQHMVNIWELRFLHYLENKGIIRRSGPKNKQRYQIIERATKEALDILESLITDDEALGRLIFTSKDPFEEDTSEDASGEELEEVEAVAQAASLEEAEAEESPSITPEHPPPLVGMLNLIAERLVDSLELLIYLRQKMEENEERAKRTERMLTRIMQELGITDKTDTEPA